MIKLVILILLFTVFAFAQRMKIYKIGVDSPQTYNLGEIDSITFSSQKMPTAGLIAYFPLNNNGYDASGNGLSTTNGGELTYTTDREGSQLGAVNLNQKGYLSLPLSNKLDITGYLFSSSIWVYSKPVTINIEDTPNPRVFGKGKDSYQLFFNGKTGSRTITFVAGPHTETSICVSNSKVPENVWTHIVITKNKLYTKIYINGKLDVNVPNTQEIGVNTTTKLELGRNAGTQYDFFPGYLDDVRFYSRELDSAEVVTLYKE